MPAPLHADVDILVIEDDTDDFFITNMLLKRAQSIRPNVQWAKTYEDGWELLLSERFTVCLCDYRLGARTGLELLRQAMEFGVRTPIILLTGQGDLEVDLQAMQFGAADYLVKGPTDTPTLERSIRYARERKRAEEQNRSQALLLDQARDAICAYTLQGGVTYLNRSAHALARSVYGYTSNGVFDLNGDEKARTILQHVLQHGSWSGEFTLTRRNEKPVVVESRWTLVRQQGTAPASILTISSDITERKQLEIQFLRAQRMESIGRLVGGIAHDLGNLLVPVLLGVKVLQTRLADDEKAQRSLAMIQKSAQRGADMVKQVLAFARGIEGERVRVDVAAVVSEVERIVMDTFPSTLQARFSVQPHLWAITGDATQVQQVLMNLCVNARDALETGGSIVVEVENFVVDAQYAENHYDAREGRYVRITVTDTGHGIPPELLDKIFEPFFTTKSVDKGTGLGLSTVYTIAKSHQGFVTVYSEVERGTSFSVFLPAHDEPGAIIRVDDEEIPAGHGEWILVVDDEPFIRETVQDILEEAQYRVLTARNGLEALTIYQEKGSAIRLVLTDIMMPEMDGISLIRALRLVAPRLPILAASGMMGEKANEVALAGANAFLSKPFTASRILRQIHELLLPNVSKT